MTFIAERRCEKNAIRHGYQHMRSHARSLNPLARGNLSMAGCEFSSSTVLRADSLHSKRARFLTAYAAVVHKPEHHVPSLVTKGPSPHAGRPQRRGSPLTLTLLTEIFGSIPEGVIGHRSATMPIGTWSDPESPDESNVAGGGRITNECPAAVPHKPKARDRIAMTKTSMLCSGKTTSVGCDPLLRSTQMLEALFLITPLNRRTPGTTQSPNYAGPDAKHRPVKYSQGM